MCPDRGKPCCHLWSEARAPLLCTAKSLMIGCFWQSVTLTCTNGFWKCENLCQAFSPVGAVTLTPCSQTSLRQSNVWRVNISKNTTFATLTCLFNIARAQTVMPVHLFFLSAWWMWVGDRQEVRSPTRHSYNNIRPLSDKRYSRLLRNLRHRAWKITAAV